MTLADSRTRGSSLRAPITSEEERAQFQDRLALVALVLFVLSIAFWFASVGVQLALGPEELTRSWADYTLQAHFATSFTSLGIWAFTRSGKRSAALLSVLDVVFAVGLCLGWAIMTATQSPKWRPETAGILACAYTLVVRAALVPSSPARTTLVGLVSMVPLTIATIYLYDRAGAPGGTIATAYGVLWGLLGVAATRTISWVIYGLRAQVRSAQQLGQYVLEEKIGEGGMGTVYRARHALLRRPTAIKLLSSATEQAVERFEREVQITARLTHPNTIAIFDYGHTPDGVFYYAMEFVDGVTLEELVLEHGVLPPARVIHVLLQACGALREAHSAGLVHRDIKPANLMLTTRGGECDVVKVLDFGLVKESVETGGVSVTHANVILGTPQYMSPEAIIDPKTIDGRADLYALGAIAFYLLTGRRVFDGNSVLEVCGKHLHEPAPAPSHFRSGVPEALDEVVLACLAKKPEQRPLDANDLAARLRRVGVEPWSEEDARAWWATHRLPVAPTPSPASRARQSSGPKTVAVALEDRLG